VLTVLQGVSTFPIDITQESLRWPVQWVIIQRTWWPEGWLAALRHNDITSFQAIITTTWRHMRGCTRDCYRGDSAIWSSPLEACIRAKSPLMESAYYGDRCFFIRGDWPYSIPITPGVYIGGDNCELQTDEYHFRFSNHTLKDLHTISSTHPVTISLNFI
jgi:hypothetical protein